VGCVILLVFLLYRYMWQPRGSTPKVGDDVMAVMIRFFAMDETYPGPGNRNCI
jgi:hypothetical protein